MTNFANKIPAAHGATRRRSWTITITHPKQKEFFMWGTSSGIPTPNSGRKRQIDPMPLREAVEIYLRTSFSA